MKPAEHDQHVAYVAGELLEFAEQHNSLCALGMPDAESRARDIVQWVTSKPVPWWKRMYYALRGRNGG